MYTSVLPKKPGTVTIVARVALPVVLALFAIAAAWTNPVARWIAWAAVSSREFLPRGIHWSMDSVLDSSGPFHKLMSHGFGYWLFRTPWPITLLVIIALGRLAVWHAVRTTLTRKLSLSAPPVQFGDWAETVSLAGWSAMGAIAWRFWWGLVHDRAVGAPPMLICEGVGHIGLLWLGAALGHAWTLSYVFGRRAANRSTKDVNCVQCRYSLEGLAGQRLCPECGHDQRLPPAWRHWQSIARGTKRLWLLGVAALLLGTPYLSSLLAAAIPSLWG